MGIAFFVLFAQLSMELGLLNYGTICSFEQVQGYNSETMPHTGIGHQGSAFFFQRHTTYIEFQD